MHRNRIRAYVDVNDPSANLNTWMASKKVSNDAWHGTMTTVVGTGDGWSSNGLYKGIACNTELVLIKVQNEEGKITRENISKALQRVLNNHKAYGIKIVNMTLGDDTECSYKESEIDTLAERLVGLGINIIAAVGNDEHGQVKPPANSPHIISVRSIDDNNQP